MYGTTSSGFAGAYSDAVTAGYPLGNGYRWYAPGLMRFNAPDVDSPFGSGGFNSYAYCGGDPANRTDPSGHSWETLLSDEVEGLVRGNAEATAAENAARSDASSASIAAASATLQQSAEAQSLTDRERELASAAFRHWHGLVRASVQRIATLSEMLESMGKRVEELTSIVVYEQFDGGRFQAASFC